MKLNSKDITFYALLIAVATIIKIVCAPNYALSGVTAIMSVALFAGLNKNHSTAGSFLLPLATLLITNVILQVLFLLHLFPFRGFYQWQFVEYSLTVVLTGLGLLLRGAKTVGIFVSAILGPTIFFFVSNYFTWAIMWQQIGYTHDTAGLLNCYTQGLPFYRNSLLSTIVLLPVFIMAYQWIMKGKATLSLAK